MKNRWKMKSTILKSLCATLVILCFWGTSNAAELEQLAVYLKGKKITVDVLEKDYSCYRLDETLERGLRQVRDLERAVRDARNNTRIAGLFPKFSAWAKYREDDRLYLYQQNNISVGKDYITVGPDDNNTTIGDVNAFEVGGKLEFDLSRLLYNPDLIKFSDQEQKLHQFRTELVEKMVYAYYYIAVVKALTLNAVEVPPEVMLPAEIAAKKLSQWFQGLTDLRLDQCAAPQ
jgi:outer membrane protein TolC